MVASVSREIQSGFMVAKLRQIYPAPSLAKRIVATVTKSFHSAIAVLTDKSFLLFNTKIVLFAAIIIPTTVWALFLFWGPGGLLIR